MILQSAIAVPPSPLAGARKYGGTADYFEIDPANAAYSFVGNARPIQALLFHGPVPSDAALEYDVGAVTRTQMATNANTASNIRAVQVAATADGGWRSLPLLLPHWADVSERADVFVPCQAASGPASGSVSLCVNWDRARQGGSGVSEGSVSNVATGPTSMGGIAFMKAGTIAGGTFSNGDVIELAIQRMAASDPLDTYNQPLLLARIGWINFKRKSV